MPKYVPFLTVEEGDDDLILAFGLGQHAETSLVLLRTPKYESLLPEEERGVSVDSGNETSSETERLVSVQWGEEVVRIQTNVRSYVLDVRAVDPDEIRQGRAVLCKMNFDGCFEITYV